MRYFGDGIRTIFDEDKKITFPILATEKTISETLDAIKFNMIDNQNTIKTLRQKIKELENAAYASDEMQKMKTQLEEAKKNLCRGFSITEEQQKQIREWQKNHEKIEHNKLINHGAVGGGYTYKFYPTAIGTFGYCCCDICMREAHKYAVTVSALSEEATYDEQAYRDYMDYHDGQIKFEEL